MLWLCSVLVAYIKTISLPEMYSWVMRDFKVASVSLGYSFLSFMKNEATVAVLSKFILNFPCSFNHVSPVIIIKFEVSFRRRNEYGMLYTFELQGLNLSLTITK